MTPDLLSSLIRYIYRYRHIYIEILQSLHIVCRWSRLESHETSDTQVSMTVSTENATPPKSTNRKTEIPQNLAVQFQTEILV